MKNVKQSNLSEYIKWILSLLLPLIPLVIIWLLIIQNLLWISNFNLILNPKSFNSLITYGEIFYKEDEFLNILVNEIMYQTANEEWIEFIKIEYNYEENYIDLKITLNNKNDYFYYFYIQ